MRRWAQTCCWTPAEEPSLIKLRGVNYHVRMSRRGEWASPPCLIWVPKRPTKPWDLLTQLYYLLSPFLWHHPVRRAKTIGKKITFKLFIVSDRFLGIRCQKVRIEDSRME